MTSDNFASVYHRAFVGERTALVVVPPEQRVPFGWSAFALPADKNAGGPLLNWPEPQPFSAQRLRVTVALDVREVKRIEARTARTGKLLGVFDIRYPSACQPFEISVAPEAVGQAINEGVRLRQTAGERPLWLFEGGGDTPAEFAPHLLGAGREDQWHEFDSRFFSQASLQAFGWIEGCVLDGLWQTARLPGGERARAALIAHLRRFVSVQGDLNYEGPSGAPLRNHVYGIEGLLPFAVIALMEPANPVLPLAERAIRGMLDKENAVIDHGVTTTEGAYTVGYPLAVMARAGKRDDLAALALAQLRARRNRNVVGGTIYQRVGGGSDSFLPNWARGVAWYLLGFARVLETLLPGKEADDLYEAFRQAALRTLPFQRADGLWGNFIDDAKSVTDTSGSAGIATALAVGARHGWLPRTALEAARRAEAGLKGHLTPDGFLGGMAQFNKAGESLQRSDYRVIAPMAMGLAAQLRAALRAGESV